MFETDTTNTNTNTNTNIKVLKWDNIDLTKQDDIGSKCTYIDNGLKKAKKGKTENKKPKQMESELAPTICDKPAKFLKDGKCYCLKHSKLTNFIIPPPDLKQSFLNNQTLQKLNDIAAKYKLINLEQEQEQEQVVKQYKKSQLISLLNNFSSQNCFSIVEKSNATKIDLVTIGRNIQHRFDDILADYLLTIDTIIIENQIGPIANKMKTIQGMLSQYFIMKNNNISIDFISASNKLKDFIHKDKDKDSKMDYK